MPAPAARTEAPSSLRKWLVAVRPWSFPASTMPVAFGTALAVVVGGARFSPVKFLWALATMVVLHAAANTLSDVFDFRRGLDREVTPVSGAVVRGWLTDVGAIARRRRALRSRYGLGPAHRPDRRAAAGHRRRRRRGHRRRLPLLKAAPSATWPSS